MALLKQNNIKSVCYTARQYTDCNQQPGRRRMTALGYRWMRNPPVLQLPNYSMATDCTTKAAVVLTVRMKSKLQGKTGGVCVSSECTKPKKFLAGVCMCVFRKKVINPPVQTDLSANNNGYFLLLSLPLSLCSAFVPRPAAR